MAPVARSITALHIGDDGQLMSDGSGAPYVPWHSTNSVQLPAHTGDDGQLTTHAALVRLFRYFSVPPTFPHLSIWFKFIRFCRPYFAIFSGLFFCCSTLLASYEMLMSFEA